MICTPTNQYAAVFFAEALGVFVCALPKFFIRWRSYFSCDDGSRLGMVTSLSCDTGSTC